MKLPMLAGLGLFLALNGPASTQTGTFTQENNRPLVERGVVVERVTTGSESSKAGLRVGDVLLSWNRADIESEIQSPFDLPRVETEQAARGAVRIEGLRGGLRHTWVLKTYGWGLAVRPNFKGDVLRLYLQGHALAHANKLSQAFECWRQAAVMTEQSEASWLGPWLLSRTAQWLFWAQQDQSGNDTYKLAVERAEHSGPVVKADILWQWASQLEYREDLVSATKHYEEVLSEWRKLGSDTIAVTASLVDLGRVTLKAGNFSEAEQYYRQILANREQLPADSAQVVASFINLGFISEERGDLARAEEYYSDALAMRPPRSFRDPNLVLLLSNLGTLANQRNNLAESESYYRRALAIAEKFHPGSLTLADVLDQLSECVAERGDPVKAREYQTQALAIREKISPGTLTVAASLAGLGRIARIRGDLAGAQEYYRRALAVGEKLAPVSLDVAGFLIGAGNVMRQKNDLAGAEGYYRRALDIMEKIAPGSVDHGETLAALAGTLRLQGRPDAAVELYGQALGDLENKTAHLGGLEKDRLIYRADHIRYYKEYMALLLEQGEPERAFEVLENSRARSLLEMLVQSQVDVRQGVGSELRTRERALRQSLNAKAEYRVQLLGAQHTGEQTYTLDKEIAQLLENLHQVDAEISAKDPAYAALTEPHPLSAPEIRQLLDPDTLLLEYSLGAEHSYVWVVSETSVQAHELTSGAEIQRVAQRLYRVLVSRTQGVNTNPDGEPAKSARADADYRKAADELSRMILLPIANLLKGKRLLIVSDGALQYIPFAALPSPDTPGVPLIVEHEIVNLPSASVLAELRRAKQGRSQASQDVAILADPVFDSNDERVTRRAHDAPGSATRSSPNSHVRGRGSALPDLFRSAADLELTRGGRVHLSRLLYTRKEAQAVMAVTPSGKGIAALDFNATRFLATSSSLAKYRIVHFATHGLLNSKHPELSGLVFSLVNERGLPQNGFLKLQDVYNLSLPVELVVLSGCETGLGEPVDGEGLVGLTRGFMYAGATRVVASLWRVSDVATADLMAAFYKALLHDGMRPAAALRAAQIQMWKQKRWKSPYYWAAFQIQGEWR